MCVWFSSLFIPFLNHYHSLLFSFPLCVSIRKNPSWRDITWHAKRWSTSMRENIPNSEWVNGIPDRRTHLDEREERMGYSNQQKFKPNHNRIVGTTGNRTGCAFLTDTVLVKLIFPSLTCGGLAFSCLISILMIDLLLNINEGWNWLLSPDFSPWCELNVQISLSWWRADYFSCTPKQER